MEETYAVKIFFPRDNQSGDDKRRENLSGDQVLIKGGKKGVASAKSELLEVGITAHGTCYSHI